VADRIGLKAWQARCCAVAFAPEALALQGPAASPRGRLPCLVHAIDRSSKYSGSDVLGADGEGRVVVVRSPKSGVSFFNLGDYQGQFEAACERSLSIFRTELSELKEGRGGEARCASGTPRAL